MFTSSCVYTIKDHCTVNTQRSRITWLSSDKDGPIRNDALLNLVSATRTVWRTNGFKQWKTEFKKAKSGVVIQGCISTVSTVEKWSVHHLESRQFSSAETGTVTGTITGTVTGTIQGRDKFLPYRNRTKRSTFRRSNLPSDCIQVYTLDKHWVL